jgi:hypothetical protein
VANKLKRRICDKQYAFLFGWRFKPYSPGFEPVWSLIYMVLKAQHLQADRPLKPPAATAPFARSRLPRSLLNAH